MGCGDNKLSKCLTQRFLLHVKAMIWQQVTLSGEAEWPKVADAVIEAAKTILESGEFCKKTGSFQIPVDSFSRPLVVIGWQ